MARILCSTGALIGKPNGRDYKLLKQLAPGLKCDGFEFMIYSSWYDEVEALVEFMKALELNIPVVHCEKEIGKNISLGGEDNHNEAFRRFEINCKIAKQLGAEKIVIHLWDGLPSDQHFENNISAYQILEQIADDYGIVLLIENVVCNCNDPLSHWSELRENYPFVRFVLDTKMSAFHNQLDLIYESEFQWLWKENRILHYHVNDYGGGFLDWANLRTLPIGEGNVDFGKFFEFINKYGVADTFTVESTAFDKQGIVDVDMLNRQFDYIRNALHEKK